MNTRLASDTLFLNCFFDSDSFFSTIDALSNVKASSFNNEALSNVLLTHIHTGSSKYGTYIFCLIAYCSAGNSRHS